MNAFAANNMDALFTANVRRPNSLFLILARVNDEHLVKGPTALKTSQVLVEVHYLWCSAEDDISFISPMFTQQSFDTGKTVLTIVSEVISEIAGYIYVIWHHRYQELRAFLL